MFPREGGDTTARDEIAESYLAERVAMLSLASGIDDGDTDEHLACIEVQGDGNCLTNAASRALTGVQLFYYSMRTSIQYEIAAHLDFYRAKLGGGFVWEGEGGVREEIRNAGPRALNAEWLSTLHVFALANVLRRPISLLAGRVEDCVFFVPSRFSPAECLVDGRMPGPLLLGWQTKHMDHYIAVVRAVTRPSDAAEAESRAELYEGKPELARWSHKFVALRANCTMRGYKICVEYMNRVMRTWCDVAPGRRAAPLRMTGLIDSAYDVVAEMLDELGVVYTRSRHPSVPHSCRFSVELSTGLVSDDFIAFLSALTLEVQIAETLQPSAVECFVGREEREMLAAAEKREGRGGPTSGVRGAGADDGEADATESGIRKYVPFARDEECFGGVFSGTWEEARAYGTPGKGWELGGGREPVNMTRRIYLELQTLFKSVCDLPFKRAIEQDFKFRCQHCGSHGEVRDDPRRTRKIRCPCGNIIDRNIWADEVEVRATSKLFVDPWDCPHCQLCNPDKSQTRCISCGSVQLKAEIDPVMLLCGLGRSRNAAVDPKRSDSSTDGAGAPTSAHPAVVGAAGGAGGAAVAVGSTAGEVPGRYIAPLPLGAPLCVSEITDDRAQSALLPVTYPGAGGTAMASRFAR